MNKRTQFNHKEYFIQLLSVICEERFTANKEIINKKRSTSPHPIGAVSQQVASPA
jgi:hypothetical protein